MAASSSEQQQQQQQSSSRAAAAGGSKWQHAGGRSRSSRRAVATARYLGHEEGSRSVLSRESESAGRASHPRKLGRGPSTGTRHGQEEGSSWPDGWMAGWTSCLAVLSSPVQSCQSRFGGDAVEYIRSKSAYIITVGSTPWAGWFGPAGERMEGRGRRRRGVREKSKRSA